MTRICRLGGTALGLLLATAVLAADGQHSTGNTDGFLTWDLGSLVSGTSARRTVFFLHGPDRSAAARTLDQARSRYRPGWSDGWQDGEGTVRDGDVWIRNAMTDFALAPDGAFFWEPGGVQSLRRPAPGRAVGKEWTPPAVAPDGGGQLSRVSFYLHYEGGAARHAGIRISGSPRLDGVKVVRPTRRIAPDRCLTVLDTADGRLRLEIRSAMGDGPVVAQEYLVTSRDGPPLTNVRLSVYANCEADHSHDNDHSLLDPDLGALVTLDPASKVVCLLGGLSSPDSGWSGVWPSQGPLARGGLARKEWQSPAKLPPPAPQLAESAEPATVSLTAAEAERVLEADWLLQAEGAPLPARAAEEIAAARDLARRLARRPLATAVRRDLERDEAELAKWERQLSDLRARPNQDAAHRAFYLQVRRVKRRIVFRNPRLDFRQVVFIDQPYPHGREWQHQARHRNGMMATPGGRLLLLDGLSPAGKVRKVADLPPGSYWRPDLSFDDRNVLFCYKAAKEEAFHIYEAGLDGSGLRQLTRGPFDDLDPIYLPDGGIAFVSTRTQTYVRCMPYTHVYTLHRMDGDGSNVRVLSHNNEPDWTPSLLDDGRILYSRWEYTDKALWRIQSLWTVRPDGTAHTAFYGNQSVWPDHLGEARQIPGTNKVLFTGMAHHNYFAGSLGIIDPDHGFNYPHGLTQVTPEVAWPECGRGPQDDQIALAGYRHRGPVADYKSPYPLSEEEFLVSINTGPYNLYLMDVRGNKELIYRGRHNAWYPLPVRPRPRPSVLPSSVTWPGKDRAGQKPGVFYSTDVYEGSGIPRGLVKYVRVVQADYHTFTTWDRDFRFEGPAVSAVQADSVKRILGTAPVEEDGSFYVQVPSGAALHLQLLDDRQRALQTMRSFTGVMPGEVRGCVGCHEGQGRASLGEPKGQALRRPPSVLSPPPWGSETVSYPRLVQPVLDRYCVRCHDGGKASAAPDLKGAPGKGIASALHRGETVFSEPYLYLIRSGLANVIASENYDQRDPAAYRTLPPLAHLSYRSKLLELAESGKHHGVKVDETSRLQLIGWIDANGPYRGLDDVRRLNDARCRDAPDVPRP
jgi:hypothetical protein